MGPKVGLDKIRDKMEPKTGKTSSKFKREPNDRTSRDQRDDQKNPKKRKKLEVILKMSDIPCQETLAYRDQKINSVESLLDLKVKSIDLSSNRLTNADFMARNSFLEHLNLSRNQLTCIPTFWLPNLIKLNLSHNPLKSLESLKHCPSLKEVILNHCELDSADKLVCLPGLHVIILSFNYLKTFTLDGFPYLKKLQIGSNRISEITLRNCPQLHEIRMRDNQVKNPVFENLPAVRVLDVSKNPMDRSTVLGLISQFDRLREFHFLPSPAVDSSLEPEILRMSSIRSLNSRKIETGLRTTALPKKIEPEPW